MTLCPRVLTTAAKDRQKAVKACLTVINGSPVGDPASLSAMVDRTRLLATDTDVKGVRLDLAITSQAGASCGLTSPGCTPRRRQFRLASRAGARACARGSQWRLAWSSTIPCRHPVACDLNH